MNQIDIFGAGSLRQQYPSLRAEEADAALLYGAAGNPKRRDVVNLVASLAALQEEFFSQWNAAVTKHESDHIVRQLPGGFKRVFDFFVRRFSQHEMVDRGYPYLIKFEETLSQICIKSQANALLQQLSKHAHRPLARRLRIEGEHVEPRLKKKHPQCESLDPATCSDCMVGPLANDCRVSHRSFYIDVFSMASEYFQCARRLAKPLNYLLRLIHARPFEYEENDWNRTTVQLALLAMLRAA